MEGFEAGQMSVTMFEILTDKLSSLFFQAWVPYFVKHNKIIQHDYKAGEEVEYRTHVVNVKTGHLGKEL